MEEKNKKTVYVVQRIRNGDGVQEAENMEFEECKSCHEMVPVIKNKCSCNGVLIHACQSIAKKEALVGEKTELIEIKNCAITQRSDGSIAYYFECDKCKDLNFMKLRVLE